MIGAKPLGIMNPLQYLRAPNRRGSILVWMLLLAYACAPLARALPGPELTVLVPFCAGEREAGRGHPAPRHVALRFTVGVPAAGTLPGAALPVSHAAPHTIAAAGCTADRARSAPLQALPISRRPPPRAPPGPPLQL